MDENSKIPAGWGDTEDEEDYVFPEEDDAPWGAAASSDDAAESDDTETPEAFDSAKPADSVVSRQNISSPKKSNTPLIIGIAAVVMIAGVGGVFGGIMLTKERAKPDGQESITATEITESLETTGTTTSMTISATEIATESTEATTAETETGPLTFAEEYVNAVLENESSWKSSLGDGSNECWFQDLDMDGVPEFIAGGYLFINGKFQYAAFHPYYFENGELQPMSNGGDGLQLLFDAGQSSGGQDGFICQLFKDRQSGSFSYMYQSVDVTGHSISYYLNRIPCHYTHTLPFDTLLTLEYDGEYSYGGMDSTMTREQFLAAYDSVFEENAFYRTYTKPVSCSEISFEALLDSYEAWSYEKSTASTMPLADVVSDVRNYQEKVPTTEMPTEIVQEIPPETERPTINAWIDTRSIPVDDDGDGIYEGIADGYDLYLCVSGDFDSYYYEFYMGDPDDLDFCNSGTISSSELYLTSGSGGFAVIVGLIPIAADGTQGEAVYASLVL